MASRIKRQKRLMKASEDGAISLAEEPVDALDNLESKRLSFGDHHMTVTIYAETEEKLEAIAAELRNITASEGVNLINESFAAWTHYFAQHPGNGQMRSRKAAITNTNFADLAALHRGQLGKPGDRVPWGKPITLFPTPERSGFLFNYHETGQPDKKPTGGHTLILGRPGSGKSVLSAFLMTQARRCDGAHKWDVTTARLCLGSAELVDLEARAEREADELRAAEPAYRRLLERRRGFDQ